MLTSNIHVLSAMVNRLAQRSELGTVDIEALLNLPHRIIRFDPGGYLVREGDKVKNCIVILSGFVYRSKVTGDGARQILSIYMSGDLIDLHNGFLGQADYNVQALNRVEVALIPHRDILSVVKAYPAIAQALWHDVVVGNSIYQEWMLNLGRRDARQRIAHLFCELSLRQEAAGLSSSPSHKLSMTQEQIGDATGLTAVHVNRTVQRMRSEGLIDSSKGFMTIIDWKRLQAAGDFRKDYLHLTAPPG